MKNSTSGKTASRPEVTLCHRSIDYFEHCVYTHVIVWVPIRLISLLFRSYQFTDRKKFEHRVEKNATVNAFFEESRFKSMILLLVNTIFLNIHIILLNQVEVLLWLIDIKPVFAIRLYFNSKIIKSNEILAFK